MIPFSTLSVASAIHGYGTTSVPFLTARALDALNERQSYASWFPIDSSFGAWILERDFDPDLLESLQETVTSWVGKHVCKCKHLTAKLPVLQNCTGHLILRHKEQWACVFEPLAAKFMSSNARNRTFPDEEFVHHKFEDLAKCLGDLHVPVFSSASGAFVSQEVFERMQISTFTAEATTLTWDAVDAAWLTSEVIFGARDTIWDLRLRTGQWDKQLHRNFGICARLDDAKWVENIVFGSRFPLWGWAHSITEAKIVAMQHILQKAFDRGVIADPKSLRKLPKHVHSISNVQQWFLQLLGSDDLPEIPYLDLSCDPDEATKK